MSPDESLAAQIAWAAARGLALDWPRVARIRALLRGDVTMAMLIA